MPNMNEEIIELDLNKPLGRRRSSYASYMDEVERLSTRPRKPKREFITVVH